MSLEKHAVAVTGIGLVTAFGSDVEEFWNSCLQGRTVIAETPTVWSRHYTAKSKHWSPLTLPDFREVGIRRSELLSYDIAALIAVYAAEQALAFSNYRKSVVDERMGRFRLDDFDIYRCGTYIGTGLGCITSTFQNYIPHLLGKLPPMSKSNSAIDFELSNEMDDILREHPRVLPIAATKCMANSISSLLSLRFALRGGNETTIAACAAGSMAVARAYEQISTGRVDFAIAGGTEYYGDSSGAIFMAFDRLNALAKPGRSDFAINRPFDAERSGFLFSQGGACILTLENMAFARARGAAVLAELKGAFATSDAYSLAALDPSGSAIQKMIQGALSEAGLSPCDVQYINTHGTGTIQNDELEARLIESLFPQRPLVNSTKSLLGHTIGACGALEAAVSVLSILNSEVHPSINLNSPIRDLNFARKREEVNVTCALTYNFGFGGHNVGLVFSKS